MIEKAQEGGVHCGFLMAGYHDWRALGIHALEAKPPHNGNARYIPVLNEDMKNEKIRLLC
jgi:hypothetical protein